VPAGGVNRGRINSPFVLPYWSLYRKDRPGKSARVLRPDGRCGRNRRCGLTGAGRLPTPTAGGTADGRWNTDGIAEDGGITSLPWPSFLSRTTAGAAHKAPHRAGDSASERPRLPWRYW